MTEYDYSPEAYERYLSTQRRIASWVDRTETCRPQFANALAPPSDYLPGHDDPRTKRPGRRLQRRHSQHFRSRSPSVESSSSDEYGYGPSLPGPMPMRSAPGHMGGGFPPGQLPWNQPPLVSQQRPMPPSYYGAPGYPHRPTHSHGHRYYHQAPLMQSPPISPGPYGIPPPHGYVMVPQHGRSGPIPYVYL